MLDLLVKYAVDHELVAEPGFAPKTAKWCISFSSDGRCLGISEIGDTSNKKNPGQTFKKCPELQQKELVGGGEPRSHFLMESAQTVALLFANSEDEKNNYAKASAKRKYFLDLLANASGSMPALGIAAQSMADERNAAFIHEEAVSRKVKPTDRMTIAIGGGYPVESDAWHDWWREFRDDLNQNAKTREGMRCFVTGGIHEPLATMPKILRLSDVGGLPTGDAFSCYDKEAFRSYGLEQSANCAVCEESAFAYRAALNDLIENHSKKLAGTKVAHWFSHPVRVEDDPFAWLDSGYSDERQERDAQYAAAGMLDAIRTGKRSDLSGNRYYALTLSGASGRVMVRDWMEGSFEDLLENIESWFADLSIVRRDGTGTAQPPKFMAVMGALVRDLADIPAPMLAGMWHTAVNRRPIPRSALAQALARARIAIIKDDPASHARMGLIRAYHVRNTTEGEQMTVFLNEDHPNPAYQCGRLMAVLADLQRSALGDVGAGIVQRYYAAASSTPALILGRLTRTSQFHLGKLDPGLAYWYEGKIAGIWARLENNLPMTLNLEEQSLFALGYYQQIADKRNSNKKNAEEKENV
jgi:CRISPR-associated protein Csd1